MMENSSRLIENNNTSDQTVILITQHVQTLIGLVGIIGNILSIFVFSCEKLRNASYSFYFRIMAFSDILMLIHTLRHWARVVLNYDLSVINLIICKLSDYQPMVAGHFSLILQTIILIDRLFMIVYHNRFTIIKRKWFQMTLVSAVFLFCSIANFSMYLNHQIIEVENSDSKHLLCSLPIEVSKKNFLRFYIEFPILFLINCFAQIKLIVFIFNARGRVANRVGDRISMRDLKFATSSIILTIFTFFTKLPLGLGAFVSGFFRLPQEQVRIVFTICITCACAANAASFYINMLFNSIFREEFFNLFKRKQSSRIML